MTKQQAVSIAVDATTRVSGLLQVPQKASVCCVLAHGSGAGMTHPFMAAIADGLGQHGIATCRYQFLIWNRIGSGQMPRNLPKPWCARPSRKQRICFLTAGGKSFGGRMTSQAQASSPLPGVRVLVFLGFPFHPAGRQSGERGDHLFEIKVPMLFLQGSRDALAETELVKTAVKRLAKRATLKLLQGADHSFHVSARSGRNDEEVRAEMLDELAGWLEANV